MHDTCCLVFFSSSFLSFHTCFCFLLICMDLPPGVCTICACLSHLLLHLTYPPSICPHPCTPPPANPIKHAHPRTRPNAKSCKTRKGTDKPPPRQAVPAPTVLSLLALLLRTSRQFRSSWASARAGMGGGGPVCYFCRGLLPEMARQGRQGMGVVGLVSSEGGLDLAGHRMRELRRRCLMKYWRDGSWGGELARHDDGGHQVDAVHASEEMPPRSLFPNTASGLWTDRRINGYVGA